MGEAAVDLHHELRRRLLAKPFEPFSVETTDGRRLEVARKFQAAVNELIMIYMPPDERGHQVVRLNEVKAIIPAA